VGVLGIVLLVILAIVVVTTIISIIGTVVSTLTLVIEIVVVVALSPEEIGRIIRPSRIASSGGVAEWLGRGLQSPVLRFESGRRLQKWGFVAPAFAPAILQWQKPMNHGVLVVVFESGFRVVRPDVGDDRLSSFE